MLIIAMGVIIIVIVVAARRCTVYPSGRVAVHRSRCGTRIGRGRGLVWRCQTIISVSTLTTVSTVTIIPAVPALDMGGRLYRGTRSTRFFFVVCFGESVGSARSTVGSEESRDEKTSDKHPQTRLVDTCPVYISSHLTMHLPPIPPPDHFSYNTHELGRPGLR